MDYVIADPTIIPKEQFPFYANAWFGCPTVTKSTISNGAYRNAAKLVENAVCRDRICVLLLQ